MKKTDKHIEKETTNLSNGDCFIIMPIADADGYDKGHFRKVYEDIHRIACIEAGFTPVRADEVQQTNLIHLDILQKLIESPMAICDLSNRNPNVLFELGLRQAFDKPTVLVQEVGTPQIFDISPLRYTQYRKELKYREVLEDQLLISEALKATKEATEKGIGVNSIVSLLSLSKPASLKEVTEDDSTKMLQVIMAEMNELRSDVKRSMAGQGNNGTVTMDALADRNSNLFKFFFEHRYLMNVMHNPTAPSEVVINSYNKMINNLLRVNQEIHSVERREQVEIAFREAEAAFSEFLAKLNSSKKTD